MEQRTEVETTGEFGLIERLASKVNITLPGTVKGIGDDAAVYDAGGPRLQLVSTDMLSEGVHFDLAYMPLKHLGYKAVAVNVSDIAAMNGIPERIVISIGVSNRFSLEAIEELYEGVRLACENYKVDLVGGDTTSSRSGLILNVTVLGSVESSKIAYRHTAQKGDLLCVTGDLGAAYMGLHVLEREKRGFLDNPGIQPALEGKEYIVGRQLKPEARTDMVHEFEELGLVPTSMIDVSDGLSSEVLHLCKNSNLGVHIFDEKLPLDKMTVETAEEFNIAPSTAALNGGEDYELLFTVAQQDFDKIKNHPDISIIGVMKEPEAGCKLVLRSGGTADIQAQGWVHF